MSSRILAELPVAFAEPEEEGAESTEELLPHLRERWFTRRRVAATAVAVGSLVACTVLAAVALPGGRASNTAGANALSLVKPVTVRQLLEGHELTDAVTDNFMSLGHGYLSPARRGEVRAAVADNLANISGSIRLRLPQDHAKLEAIQLSEVQKGAVLRLLQLYSDPRVQHLGNTMARASAQASDRESLKRQLSETLKPQLPELRELCDDIAPGSGKDLKLDADDFDDFEPPQTPGKWHLTIEMTPPKVSGPAPAGGGLLAARRLTARDTLSGTRDQTSVVLHHLHGMLGEAMPQAPARMLLFEKQKELEAQTTGWERFEKCVMENISNPPDMFKCLMTNCKRAMTWLINKLHLTDMMQKFMSTSGA